MFGVIIWLFLFLFFSIVIFNIVRHSHAKKLKEQIIRYIQNTLNITCTKKIIGELDNKSCCSAIVIDDFEKNIYCINANKNGSISHTVYKYDELIASEIYEDANTIIKTSKSNQIANMALGSVVLGIPGAIVSGMSATQQSVSNVKQLGMKITINNIDNPLFYILFINNPNGISKNDLQYKRQYHIAEELHGIISIIIKQCEKNEHTKSR